jgi:methionine-S-sulfoxide reductase
MTEKLNNKLQKAVFGGGCFWCLEAIFQNLKGVEKVTSGYSGGYSKNPTYQEVSSGISGHAEVIEIQFRPSEISYMELLLIFFQSHNPTTLDQQGADKGEQYRSVVFYTDLEQKNETQSVIEELTTEKIFKDKIVTKIQEFENFYPAEGYHQNYYKNNPDQSYCKIVISPKLKKLQENFKQYLQNKSV